MARRGGEEGGGGRGGDRTDRGGEDADRGGHGADRGGDGTGGGGADPAAEDAVDRIAAQWHRERPDLSLRAMRIFGRLGRLGIVGHRLIDETLAAFDLKLGEFDVLAALRRAGEPYELNPTDLYQTLMLSSGAMTNRLDRLEQAGLVRRRPDPEDRRATLVSLTAAGKERIDRAVEAHVANEERLLSGLSAKEQDQLDRLVRKLLAAAERPA